MIYVHTDGSARFNPGDGGWAAIVVRDDLVTEIGGFVANTTNNRMEMLSAIKALETIGDGESVTAHSDSAYLVNGIKSWIDNWQKNNWKTSNRGEVLNKDLWLELLVHKARLKIEWKKVKGHADDKWNNRCDEIATTFSAKKPIVLYSGSLVSYVIP